MSTLLRIKSNYSLLSSLVEIKSFVAEAKKLGYDTLALTDNGVMYGVMEFYKECVKNNLKPIIGLELNLEDKNFLLYAKNYKGYQNLIKLSTIYKDEELKIENLREYKNDLVAVVPIKYQEFYEVLKKIYEDIFYGYEEIKDYHYENSVYIKEINSLKKEDINYLTYLYMIRDNKTLSDDHDYHLDKKAFLLPIDEFKNIEQGTNDKLSNLCNLEIKHNPDLLPELGIADENKYLKDLSYAGLKKRMGDKVPQNYLDRLNFELSIIEKMGFEGYFLVVYDFVKYAKKNSILVGPGRGSAVGSLLSYTLGITDIDPLQYNLLFERFLNPERISMPDIDIDFPDDKRDQMVDYVKNKYGEKKVAQIITFGTLGARQVIRDVARVLQVSTSDTDKLCKLLGNDLNIKLMLTLKSNKKLQELLENNQDLKNVYNISLKLEGMPRHTSIHAAGVVISKVDVDTVIPVYKGNSGVYITGYSMEHLEELGLLKMDFLGIKNLSTIDNIINDIRLNQNIDIRFSDIPLDDEDTLKLFKEVNTNGIFQFESAGMKNFLRKLKASSFDDVVSAIAMFRPGPMDNIDSFVKRKEGKEKIVYLHQDLEPILSSTYGIIVYQEQIMEIAHVLANYSLGEADVLRRAMSKKKKEVLGEEKEKFVKRSIKNGYQEAVASEVYDLILKFANYGFNKSHSVAYSVIGFKMAYLKAHYPNYFLTNLLNGVIGSEIKTKDYILEAKANNLTVLAPNINMSTDRYLVDDDVILMPLTVIKNVGAAITKTIIEERENGPFKDIFNFVARVTKRGIGIKTIEVLIKANCFSNMKHNKRTLLENLDVILNYGELIIDLDRSMIEQPCIEIKDEYGDDELLKGEVESFGFYIRSHPVSKYKTKYHVINVNEIKNYFNKDINIVISIDKLKVIETKKQEKMAFITGSDETGAIEIIGFPKVYNLLLNVRDGDILLINGKVERRLDKTQVIINKLKELSN